MNRLSVGGFTLDDTYNALVKRHHTRSDTFQALEVAKARFPVVNTDLVLGLPDRDGAAFMSDLIEIVKTGVGITHYTWRSTRPEERDTVFYKKGMRHPSWRDIFIMRHAASTYLREHGYTEQPLNYWRPAGITPPQIYENRWGSDRIPMIGFGPGAYSYWHTGQWDNLDSLKQYAAGVRDKALPTNQAGLLGMYESIWWGTALSLKNNGTGLGTAPVLWDLKRLGLFRPPEHMMSSRFELTEAGRVVTEEIINYLQTAGLH